jgi:hypothetical protein
MSGTLAICLPSIDLKIEGMSRPEDVDIFALAVEEVFGMRGIRNESGRFSWMNICR